MISSSVTSGCPPPLVAPAVTATLNMVPKHTFPLLYFEETRSSDVSVQHGSSQPSVSAVHLFLPDDLPDLQEVQEEAEPTVPPVYQVDMDVSHQEPSAHTHTQPPDTHRLTQLAHIATGPQSPLLQESPVSRSELLLLSLVQRHGVSCV